MSNFNDHGLLVDAFLREMWIRRKAIGGGLRPKHKEIVHGFVMDLPFFFAHVLREHDLCL